MNMNEHPLVILYGENAFEEALAEIKELKKHSNTLFHEKHIKLGADFMTIKADDILKNNKPKPSLRALVSGSFGEAAIYEYNVCGGIL